MKRFVCLLLGGLFAVSSTATVATAADKIPVLIVDGQNNHDYRLMTPQMKHDLEKTGKFTVDVSTSPARGAEEAAWDAWRPEFDKYKVVVSNYNGAIWPEAVKLDFERYVRRGGGVLIIHAANNAFTGWREYDRMIGLGWRNAAYGKRLYAEDDGSIVTLPAGEDRDAGHGSQHAYQITVRDEKHPVMKGIPTVWMHARDELYHGQRGPAADMHLLATAYSDPEQGGTGKHEPMVWWIPYGNGKVLTNVMGHVGGNQKDRPAIRCAGFVSIMNRGCEWLATDKVTLPVPDQFPSPDEKLLVPNYTR